MDTAQVVGVEGKGSATMAPGGAENECAVQRNVEGRDNNERVKQYLKLAAFTGSHQYSAAGDATPAAVDAAGTADVGLTVKLQQKLKVAWIYIASIQFISEM